MPEASSLDGVVSLVTPFLLKGVYALVIFIVGRMVAKAVAGGLRKVLVRAKVDETLVKFVCNLGYTVLLAFVILAALNQLGVETTSFVAIIGAAGLAVGFALKDSLSNFASGVMMLIFRPFGVGDFIDAGGTMGIVEEIQLFTTMMRTPDNKAIIVPNSKIMGDTITNFSKKDTRRVDLVVGVGYEQNVKKVKETLEDILNADDRILKDPAYTIGLLNMGESSLDFAVRPWVKASNYWDVYFHLQETIKERFEADGISIPFPQRTVHVVKDESAA